MTKKQLPKIDLPIFSETLPSGIKVKFRPFTGKEEKILLIGAENKDVSDSLISVIQVMSNCLIDEDLRNLTSLDFEYLTLKVRSKSVSNIMEFILTDEHGEKIEIGVNIDDIKITEKDGHENKIVLSENLTLFLKQPNIYENQDYFRAKAEKDPYADYNYMLRSFDTLVDSDTSEVFDFSEYTQEEIVQFADEMNKAQIDAIKKFFQTMPVLRHEAKYMNSKGEQKTLVIEGMEFFFA